MNNRTELLKTIELISFNLWNSKNFPSPLDRGGGKLGSAVKINVDQFGNENTQSLSLSEGLLILGNKILWNMNCMREVVKWYFGKTKKSNEVIVLQSEFCRSCTIVLKQKFGQNAWRYAITKHMHRHEIPLRNLVKMWVVAPDLFGKSQWCPAKRAGEWRHAWKRWILILVFLPYIQKLQSFV